MPNDPGPTQFGLPEKTITLIRTVFSRHPQVEQVILYGSRAKGTYKKGSDIDLTIKGDGVTLSELFQIENELDDLLLPYKIDLSLMHKLGDPSLIEHVERVGRILYSAGTEYLL
ncbi:nucleotidyltransferase domain-containing protein [Geomesophilobacter sediminis]|uniref:Nucleotidyltransferase domain-containing protein n=1 Tax=Geomesophilobacter sediminis TaxID=2798584 RepID=A0A8J7IVZ9_9BACT|nr:nucleotidyltransferase domain-containing protein [Geomesophilobacter sediminis]MBJ6723497.1 nucleotidyltransferase domain-containing protein [Geomesophilobacter sediminis]